MALSGRGGFKLLFEVILAFGLCSRAAVASDGIVNISGWTESASNVFLKNSTSAVGSISGAGVIGTVLGIRVTVTAACPRIDGLEFSVGIANSDLDVIANNSSGAAQVVYDLKLGAEVSDKRIVQTTNANKFSFTHATTRKFLSQSEFLIGIPIEGTEKVLRIPLKDVVIQDFLSRCNARQLVQQAEQKAAEATAKAAAVEAARKAAEAAKEQAAEEQAKAAAAQRQAEIRATALTDQAIRSNGLVQIITVRSTQGLKLVKKNGKFQWAPDDLGPCQVYFVFNASEVNAIRKFGGRRQWKQYLEIRPYLGNVSKDYIPVNSTDWARLLPTVLLIKVGDAFLQSTVQDCGRAGQFSLKVPGFG